MKILYLKTEDPAISHLNYNDFLHDTLLIGLRNNFGNNVVDYPGAWYMYPKERKKRINDSTEKIWGNLFTLYDSLQNYELIDRDDIKKKIEKNFFNLIIFGSSRGKNLFLEEAIKSKSKIIFIDTSDDGYIDVSKINKGLYFKRELYSTEKNVYPIHFAIPKKKIVSSINLSPKNILSPLIPGKMETYIYKKENEYYEMYQNSLFSLTYKKNGWDCLRHYEILANGSIPLFIKLEDCPNQTLTSLPKKKLLKFYNLYNKILSYYNPLKIYKKRFMDLNKFYYYGKNFFKKEPSVDSFIKNNQEINQVRSYLLEYAKNNLTSEKLAEYVINTSNIFFK
mgnify:CR=1 FL=1